MSLFNKIVTLAFGQRLRTIEKFRNDPFTAQNQQFRLLCSNKNQYLSKFGDVSTIEKFQKNIPIVDYDEYSTFINQVRDGNQDAIWSGSPTPWAAKSSGTTGSVSKFIPTTKRYLNHCHYRGARDTTAVFAQNFPKSKAFSGKSLTLGGSSVLEREGGLKVGDLSAILIENTPFYAKIIREPKPEVALIADFEKKVEAICKATVGKNLTSFAGVPSWNLILMQKVLQYTGKNNIHEVWPDMSLFIHGGIAFTPYRKLYEELFPSPEMLYMETYNASEGFFALQDDPTDSSMLLMLDYEVFYEFIPLSTLEDYSTAVPLEGVKTGVNYAMVISTSSGLWRYIIGDTVEFTSLSPHKIRITGRTKSYINTFGEELIVDNAEKALKIACEATGAIISEYTAAPIFMESNTKGSHQWVIEFAVAPNSQVLFNEAFDKALQDTNSDYAAKRHNNTTLNAPTISVVEQGTFIEWLSHRGKKGGQNKVQRLSGKRDFVEQLLSIKL